MTCLLSTAFESVIGREQSRFQTLFRRRAMLHHYTKFLPLSDISSAADDVAAVLAAYAALRSGCAGDPFRPTSEGNSVPQLFPAF